MLQSCHPERSEGPLYLKFQENAGVLPSRCSGPATPPQDDRLRSFSAASLARHLEFLHFGTLQQKSPPSPLWGRGWTATRAFTSGGGTGEGVKTQTCLTPCFRYRPSHGHHFFHKQLRRFENHAVGDSHHGIARVLQVRIPLRISARRARLPLTLPSSSTIRRRS